MSPKFATLLNKCTWVREEEQDHVMKVCDWYSAMLLEARVENAACNGENFALTPTDEKCLADYAAPPCEGSVCGCCRCLEQ